MYLPQQEGLKLKNKLIVLFFLSLFSFRLYAEQSVLLNIKNEPLADIGNIYQGYDRKIDMAKLHRLRNFCGNGWANSLLEHYKYLKSGASHGVGLVSLRDENFFNLMGQKNLMSGDLYQDINSIEFEIALNECGLNEAQKTSIVLTLVYFDTAGTTLGAIYFSKFLMKVAKIFSIKSPKWFSRVSKTLFTVGSIALASKVYGYIHKKFRSKEDKEKEVEMLKKHGAIVIQSVEDLEQVIPKIDTNYRKNLAINLRFKLWMMCRNVQFKIENDLYDNELIDEKIEKLGECKAHIRSIEEEYSFEPLENFL